MMTQSLVRNITSISISRRILVTLLTPAKHYINHIYYLRIAPLYHTAFGLNSKATATIDYRQKNLLKIDFYINNRDPK